MADCCFRGELSDGRIFWHVFLLCGLGLALLQVVRSKFLKCVIFLRILKTNLQMCSRKRWLKNYDKKLCFGKNQIKISDGSAFVLCLLCQVTVKLSAEDVSLVLLSGLFSNVAQLVYIRYFLTPIHPLHEAQALTTLQAIYKHSIK